MSLLRPFNLCTVSEELLIRPVLTLPLKGGQKLPELPEVGTISLNLTIVYRVQRHNGCTLRIN